MLLQSCDRPFAGTAGGDVLRPTLICRAICCSMIVRVASDRLILCNLVFAAPQGDKCTPAWYKCKPKMWNKQDECCPGYSCQEAPKGCKVGRYVCQPKFTPKCGEEGFSCGGKSGGVCCEGEQGGGLRVLWCAAHGQDEGKQGVESCFWGWG
jgi:hypothetical protein